MNRRKVELKKLNGKVNKRTGGETINITEMSKFAGKTDKLTEKPAEYQVYPGE